jgi:hypothetical protein
MFLAAMGFGRGVGIGGRIGVSGVDGAFGAFNVLFGRCSRFLGVGLRYHQVRSR